MRKNIMEEKVGYSGFGIVATLIALAVVGATASAHNGGPTANAGADQDVTAGSAVTFSASGSNASSTHNIILYSWNFGDSASGSNNSATGTSVTHTFTTESTYTVSLTVTDDHSPALTATDTASVVVRANDTVAPTIDHTQPSTTPTAGSAINITANVTDNVAVSTVTLFYKNTTGSSYVNTTMTRVGTTAAYYASIPGSVTTANVNYYLQAVDTKPGTPNSALLPTGAPSSNFTVNVTDNQAPSITHTATTSTTANIAVNLTAEVTDNINVSVVDIRYRVGTSGSFTAVNMTRGTGNNWTGQIPASAVTSAGVQYWINATDGTNSATSPAGADISGSAAHTIGVTSALAPSITHNNVTSASSLTGFTLQATISGQSGRFINHTRLYYKPGTGNDSAWVEAAASLWNNQSSGSPTVYSGSIPGSAIDDKGVYYYINASDSGGENSSTPSAGRSNPYFVPTPPGTPAGLTATRSASTTMSLAWTGPSTNATNTVSYYKVYRRLANTTGTLTALSSTTTTTSFSDTGLTSGTAYNYTASAVDAQGNEGSQSSERLGGATFVPTTTTTTTTSTPSSGGTTSTNTGCTATVFPSFGTASPADGSTVNNTARPTITLTYTKNGALTITQFKLDGTVQTTGPSFGDTSVSFTPAANLTNGSHTINVTIANCFGSRSTGWSFTVSVTSAAIDTTLPVIVGVSPTDGSTVTDATPLIGADYSDDVGIDVAAVTLTLDGTVVSATAGAASVTFTPASNLADGLHTVSLEVKDAAGNKATKSWSFTVSTAPLADTVKPTFGSPTPADGATVEDTTPEISITYSDNVGVVVGSVEMKLDGTDVTSLAAISVTGLRFTPTTALAVGEHIVAVTIADEAGNAATKSWKFTVQLPDPEKPVITALNGPAPGSKVKGSIALSASVTDNVGVTGVTYFVDGEQVNFERDAPYDFSLDTTKFSDGTHTIRAVARDAAGNTAEKELTLTFENAAKPAAKPLIPGPGVALAVLALFGALLLRRRK